MPRSHLTTFFRFRLGIQKYPKFRQSPNSSKNTLSHSFPGVEGALQVAFCGAWLERSRVAPMTLCGLFASQQSRGNEFSDILAKPALSIEQTHFQKVCPGNKRHETNTISHDGGDKLADDRHATSAFNSRDNAQCVSAFLADH